MVAYIVRRLLLAVLTVWAISVLSFMIIHLPPGDYVTSYIASMSASGSAVSEGEAQALRENLQALINDLQRAKPATSKGIYLKRVTLSSTMGPGVIVDQSTLV